uniref:Uncharacterized protein n=1 Tax=Angiostrongylus cantonensis TaxID=6313 RepID=A0A0K0CWP7_ANGCA
MMLCRGQRPKLAPLGSSYAQLLFFAIRIDRSRSRRTGLSGRMSAAQHLSGCKRRREATLQMGVAQKTAGHAPYCGDTTPEPPEYVDEYVECVGIRPVIGQGMWQTLEISRRNMFFQITTEV